MFVSAEPLHDTIVNCCKCPRLVAFRETVPIRPSLLQEKPWRRPVPGFGDEKAWLLILGLAPSAGGANRTGRMFTGDETARFLIQALYKMGFANQPTSTHIADGLKFTGCYLTAAVKCVPPQNRPSKEEFCNCSPYLENEIFLLKHLRAVLGLGKLAFDAYQDFLIRQQALHKKAPFTHGAHLSIPGWPALYGSYHPSPQNTYTGKLTEPMFLSLLRRLQQEMLQIK
jgi:uracil-DNA glycosylase